MIKLLSILYWITIGEFTSYLHAQKLGFPIGTSIYKDPQSQPQCLRLFEVEDRHLKILRFFEAEDSMKKLRFLIN